MPLVAPENTGWLYSVIANLEGQLDKIENCIKKIRKAYFWVFL